MNSHLMRTTGVETTEDNGASGIVSIFRFLPQKWHKGSSCGFSAFALGDDGIEAQSTVQTTEGLVYHHWGWSGCLGWRGVRGPLELAFHFGYVKLFGVREKLAHAK